MTVGWDIKAVVVEKLSPLTPFHRENVDKSGSFFLVG
jgi:hypothetical protein